MRYLVYTALTFIALLLFLPRTGSGGIRNLPLLAAILALLAAYLIYRAVRRIMMLSRVKGVLRESGYMICRSALFPLSFPLFRRPDIIAERKDTTLNISLYSNVKRPLHYHFDSVRTLETYKSTRMAVIGRSGGYVSKHTETVKAGKRRLGWSIDEGELYALVLGRMPARVSDSSNTELFPGDMIEGRVMLLCADDITMLRGI